MTEEEKKIEIEPVPEVKREEPTEEQKTTKKRVKKPKNNDEGSNFQFLYDPKRKTVLGRDAMNWAKLATFYTVFFFCLGCFFVSLLYVFALLLDREVPTYYDSESAMAVRTTASVVGMGFRPQPEIDDSVIRVSDNEQEQKRIASSLRLFRDIFLLQKSDARTEKCDEKNPASELPRGVACAFNWFDIVQSQSHPCSDNNYYGFKNQEPCVLVKVNKVFGWSPSKSPIPQEIQELLDVQSNKSTSDSDVYVTCAGSHPVDQDALTEDIIYYSLDNTAGSTKYGAIPNYFFPYRNARDHVQPFILAQFKGLPMNRLISITCRLWAPGIEHDTRGMRGMVNFQLYREKSGTKVVEEPNDAE